jgi:hypothetical protein
MYLKFLRSFQLQGGTFQDRYLSWSVSRSFCYRHVASQTLGITIIIYPPHSWDIISKTKSVCQWWWPLPGQKKFAKVFLSDQLKTNSANLLSFATVVGISRIFRPLSIKVQSWAWKSFIFLGKKPARMKILTIPDFCRLCLFIKSLEPILRSRVAT